MKSIGLFTQLKIFSKQATKEKAACFSGHLSLFRKLFHNQVYKLQFKNSIFQNSLIFQGLPPIKYQNLMYFPLFLPL